MGGKYTIPREFFIDGSLVFKKHAFLKKFLILLNVFMLPIAIYWLLHFHLLLGSSLLLFLAGFNANVYALFNNRPFIVTYSLVMISLSLTLFLAVYYLGFSASLWTYPIVIAIYFIIPIRHANIFNLITVIPIASLLAMEYEYGLALRYCASMGATLVLGNNLVTIITDLHQQLVLQSVTDPLTGAFNRRKMDQTLASLLDQYRVNPQNNALLMIDIDFFKKINDTYGHEVGDITLRDLVNKLHSQVRKTDMVFRIGGEEFLVVLPNTNFEHALHVAEALRMAVSEIHIVNTTQSITVSLGISMLMKNMTVEQWLGQADKCLYVAKEMGRNRVVSPNTDPNIASKKTPTL
jgi:diguanylate cyclase (GGDEF)-like protein